MQPGVVPGAVLELHAAKAAGGVAPGSNDPLTTQWYDTSGNGNHGTLTNIAYTSAEGWNDSPHRLTLDGSGYVANLTPSSMPTLPYALEAWIRTPSTHKNCSIICLNGAYANTMHLTSAGKVCTYVDGQNYGYNTDASNLSTSTIYHITTVHEQISSSGGLRIYINGVDVSGTQSIDGSTTYSPNVIYVGGDSRFGYSTASILAARIYPTALTAAQVAQNYHAGPLWTPARAVPVIGSPIVRGFGGTP